MHYKKWLAAGVACSLALALLSCEATREAQEKSKVMKTALAFYKAINYPTPEMEKVMELKDYRMYGYPALVYGVLGVTWGVEKLQGAGEAYEVEIPLWCHGTTAAGEEKKLRRTLLVRLIADPASAEGWAISRFKFQGDEELTFVHQFFTWLLWMFLSRMAFYLILIIFFGGFLWPKVAGWVAALLAFPLWIYVSYLWFGTAKGAVVAMVAWIIIIMFLRWIVTKIPTEMTAK